MPNEISHLKNADFCLFFSGQKSAGLYFMCKQSLLWKGVWCLMCPQPTPPHFLLHLPQMLSDITSQSTGICTFHFIDLKEVLTLTTLSSLCLAILSWYFLHLFPYLLLCLWTVWAASHRCHPEPQLKGQRNLLKASAASPPTASSENGPWQRAPWTEKKGG